MELMRSLMTLIQPSHSHHYPHFLGYLSFCIFKSMFFPMSTEMQFSIRNKHKVWLAAIHPMKYSLHHCSSMKAVRHSQHFYLELLIVPTNFSSINTKCLSQSLEKNHGTKLNLHVVIWGSFLAILLMSAVIKI